MAKLPWWQRLLGRRPAPEAVDEPAVAARDVALEAAIAADLDGVDAYLVYGDWLQQQGDPRGQLIALQATLTHRPSSPPEDTDTIEGVREFAPGDVAQAAAALIDRHRTHFLGPLDPAKLVHPSPVEWHCGFWRKLRVTGSLYDERLDAGLVEELLAHPSARFLRQLSIGAMLERPVVDAVPATLPVTLETLYLGDFLYPDESEISWTVVGDASTIYLRVPQLEHLVLQGADIGLGGRVELPRLRSLELITGGLPGEAARAIAASSLPDLEQLVVWTGDEAYGCTTTLDDVRALLDADLPRLRHLAIKNSALAERVVPHLLKWPGLAQLRVLDLSLGTFGAQGVADLVAGREKLAHLERLDLSSSFLRPEDVARAKGLCRRVDLGAQRAEEVDERARYVAVGE